MKHRRSIFRPASPRTWLTPGRHRPERMGDIGEGEREYEYEPLTTPAPERVPAAPTPEREPEEVPA